MIRQRIDRTVRQWKLQEIETEKKQTVWLNTLSYTLSLTHQVQIAAGQRPFVSLLWQINHRYGYQAAGVFAITADGRSLERLDSYAKPDFLLCVLTLLPCKCYYTLVLRTMANIRNIDAHAPSYLNTKKNDNISLNCIQSTQKAQRYPLTFVVKHSKPTKSHILFLLLFDPLFLDFGIKWCVQLQSFSCARIAHSTEHVE